MASKTLVILAAGIGSRFGGGVKQLTPVDDHGHLIIDYSIHDAIATGFNKIVFIIRKDIEADFRAVIGDRIEKIAAVCAAPSFLAKLGLLAGKKATVHPDFADKMNGATVLDESVIVDKNIITGQGLGATIPFAFEIIRILVGNETVDGIKKAICYKD